jgi:signal transduction histidine kinase
MGGRLTRAVDEIDATIKDIRRTIFELSAPLESGDLRARVVRLVEESVVTLGFRPTLTISGPVASVIDEQTGTALLAVLRESLSNVARHAGASSVEVLLLVSDRVLLSVSDDGAGIPAELVAMGGVQNMRERAERIGGTFSLTSEGHGTTLTWTAPLQPTGVA